MELYQDIYVMIAQYLTMHETKQFAITNRSTSCLRKLIPRMRLQYNVDCRPYYPKKYIAARYKKERPDYKYNIYNKYLEYDGRHIAFLVFTKSSNTWIIHFFDYDLDPLTGRENARQLRRYNLNHLLTKKKGGYTTYLYSATDTYYNIEELIKYDTIAYYKWLKKRKIEKDK